MLDMINAPIPIAIPAMAPGLRLGPLLFASVGGRADTDVVLFEGVVAVVPKETLMTDASDDAYSLGNRYRSLDCQ